MHVFITTILLFNSISNDMINPKIFLEFCAEKGHSVYIGDLPFNATPDQLEQEFQKFGRIKRNGIQVRSNKVCSHIKVCFFDLIYKRVIDANFFFCKFACCRVIVLVLLSMKISLGNRRHLR